ncbi:hypothetical protein PRIPAC_85882 [Pristionchus pacificus]|uniref:Uncharacterized protein n=1 Tax=Pristionchus pacificus TaxID=54126 RepID=A0A2A6BLI5_PRIPA|nr:hypothetical protein PRIPAC_85882 [Pristionchus pacificus]|eukprot:PDM66641.1 hypothetical protein PRIPAC_48058 [Pristionchus pacificus]
MKRRRPVFRTLLILTSKRGQSARRGERDEHENAHEYGSGERANQLEIKRFSSNFVTRGTRNNFASKCDTCLLTLLPDSQCSPSKSGKQVHAPSSEHSPPFVHWKDHTRD